MEIVIGFENMQIKLNGNVTELNKNIENLQQLIDSMKDSLGAFFAVEKNKKIIFKEQYSNEPLTENDEIEIVSLAGGG